MSKELVNSIATFLIGLIGSSKKGWQASKKYLIEFLKGETIKLIVVKILKMQAVGGVRLWIIEALNSWLFDTIGEPFIEKRLRRAGYYYNRRKGKIKVERLNEAEQNGNENDYIDASTDILR